jgi:large subunit ribosomal protein L30|tara:strand:+ start:19 stop:198 length:180 start_codon:yes stop_codon:yes gene_type:complete
MKVKIKQIKSSIGSQKNQRETIKALGLNKIGKTVEKTLNPSVEGMLNKVKHLIEVTEIK